MGIDSGIRSEPSPVSSPRAGSAKGRAGAAAANQNLTTFRAKMRPGMDFGRASGLGWAGRAQKRAQNPCQDALHAKHRRTSAPRRRRARPKSIALHLGETWEGSHRHHDHLVRARPRTHPPTLIGNRGRLGAYTSGQSRIIDSKPFKQN